MCILSPVCLLALAACSQAAASPVSEGMAAGIGLLFLTAAAVTRFVTTGLRGEKWEFLEKEAFETEYGVMGMAREKQKAFRETFVRAIAIGVALCILSPVPLFLGHGGPERCAVGRAACSLSGRGVLFVRVGTPWEAMRKLLQEDDYTAAEKKKALLQEAIAGG